MKHQKVKTVLVVWAFFIVVTGLFPPLEYNYSIEVDGIKYESRGMSLSSSYRFILNPPDKWLFGDGKFENNRIYSNLQVRIIEGANVGYYIDLRRLLVIWTIISVIFGTSFLFAYNNAVNADKVERLFYKSQKKQQKKIIDNESKEPDNA